MGTGAQLLTLSMFIFSLACMNLFYPYNRGSLYTALIVLYALTAGIAGYVGASYYKQVGAPETEPARENMHVEGFRGVYPTSRWALQDVTAPERIWREQEMSP